MRLPAQPCPDECAYSALRLVFLPPQLVAARAGALAAGGALRRSAWLLRTAGVCVLLALCPSNLRDSKARRHLASRVAAARALYQPGANDGPFCPKPLCAFPRLAPGQLGVDTVGRSSGVSGPVGRRI
uniref:Uncharacterized protein n=1 Tax=Tanacetum cinerariifolium TaxID=118510 RepID=A0A699SX31_TANCI|nr:hypothetical protein [Tanacetum cinerariifolium]